MEVGEVNVIVFLNFSGYRFHGRMMLVAKLFCMKNVINVNVFYCVWIVFWSVRSESRGNGEQRGRRRSQQDYVIIGFDACETVAA